MREGTSPIRAARFLNWQTVAIGFSLGLLFGWLAVRDLAWQEIGASIQSFPWLLGVVAILLQLLAGLLRAYRWRLLFVEEKISVGRLFLVQHVGLGLNNMFPIRVMSEPIQLVLLTLKDKLSGGSLLATMLLDRTMDGMFTAGVLWLGVLLLPFLHGMRYLVSGLFLVFAILFILGLVAPQVFKRIPAFRRLLLLGSYASAISALLASRWRFLAVLALSAGFWAITATGVWVIAIGLNMDLPWTVIAFTVIAVIVFISYLPSLPAAAGSFEFAMVYLLGMFGVDKGLAFSFALLAHLVLFLPAIGIAAFQLPREGMSFRQAVALVKNRRAAAPEALPD